MTNNFFVCFSCLLSSFFLPFKNLFEILDFEILALLGISGQIARIYFFRIFCNTFTDSYSCSETLVSILDIPPTLMAKYTHLG